MRKRYHRLLSAEERETLSLGMARGHSLRMMATVMGRDPSGYFGVYHGNLQVTGPRVSGIRTPDGGVARGVRGLCRQAHSA